MSLNEPKIIILHTVKCFEVLLWTIKNSFKHQSFVYTKLNDQTDLFLTTQFSISQKVKWFQVLLRIITNSIKHQSFIYMLLNDQTVLFKKKKKTI